MRPNPQFPADLVTFTEETDNRKLHFLFSATLESWVKNFLRHHQKMLKYFSLKSYASR